MKRYIPLATLAMILLTASCREGAYTCRCEGGLSGAGQTTTINDTRQKAKRQCENQSSAAGTPDGFTNCRIQ